MIHYRVVRIEQTCFACPSSWEGITDKGELVYARYRWGYLRVEVGHEIVFGAQLHVDDPADEESRFQAARDSGLSEEIVKSMIDSDRMMRELSPGEYSYHGTLSYEELVDATKEAIQWP